jgi:hypothetical protein
VARYSVVVRKLQKEELKHGVEFFAPSLFAPAFPLRKSRSVSKTTIAMLSLVHFVSLWFLRAVAVRAAANMTRTYPALKPPEKCP